ncbi:MAG: aminotransferase class IV [Phycisphaerae bacterium]
MPVAWINPTFVDAAEASVSLKDAGLLHAAGCFTTMRAHHGRVFRLADNLQRLRDSCEALMVPLPADDATLSNALHELLRRNALQDARVRLTVTRGTTLDDPDAADGKRLTPTAFATAAAFMPYPAEFYETGMRVVLLTEQKKNPYDLQAGHKTLDYLSQFAALKEAARHGAGEALWFDVHNYLACASVANVFVFVDGELLTPPTPWDLRDPAVADATPYNRSAVLPGVTRKVALEAAVAAGVPARPEAIDVNRLLGATEVFLTNSVMGVMPVTGIERHTVGTGGPGPVTRKLRVELARMIEAETAAG